MLRCILLGCIIFALSTQLSDEEISNFTVDVTYMERYSGQHPNVTIDNNSTNGGLLIEFNNIPSHYTGQWNGQGNNTRITKVPTKFRVKAVPEKASEALWCLPLGIIGVTIQGVAIYNPYLPEPGCLYAKDELHLDACRGRTDEDGIYHYYDYSPCVQMFDCAEPSTIYGVAIDGYPIYGPFDEYGVQLTAADLDECGGKTDTKGNYKYHIVKDKPNIVNCLKGELDKYLEMDPKLFVCNCPLTDKHFTAEFTPPCIPVNDTNNGTNNATDTDDDDIATKTGSRRRRYSQEMNLYRREATLDSAANETMDGNSTGNSTANSTECVPDLSIVYSVWGGKNITVEQVCNFSTIFDAVICKVDLGNTSKYENMVEWEYEEKTEELLACCKKGVDCGGSCWISKGDNMTTNENPACWKETRDINYKTMNMIPNSAPQSGQSWILLTITVLLAVYIATH